jgi:hypothetical protein
VGGLTGACDGSMCHVLCCCGVRNCSRCLKATGAVTGRIGSLCPQRRSLTLQLHAAHVAGVGRVAGSSECICAGLGVVCITGRDSSKLLLRAPRCLMGGRSTCWSVHCQAAISHLKVVTPAGYTAIQQLRRWWQIERILSVSCALHSVVGVVYWRCGQNTIE